MAAPSGPAFGLRRIRPGRPGPGGGQIAGEGPPAVLPEMAQRLYQRGKMDLLLDLFNHRSAPAKVLTPPRLVGATARLLARGGCDGPAAAEDDDAGGV